MNVFNNVAYPLQNMKLPKKKLPPVLLKPSNSFNGGFENRPPPGSPAGSNTRALARALVAEPKVILLMNVVKP